MLFLRSSSSSYSSSFSSLQAPSAIALLMILPWVSWAWVTTSSPSYRRTVFTPRAISTAGTRRMSSKRYVLNRSSSVGEDATGVGERALNLSSLFNRTDDSFLETTSSVPNQKSSSSFFPFPKATSKPKSTSSSRVQSTRNATGACSSSSQQQGRESVLVGIAVLAAALGIFSYTQSDAASNLFPPMMALPSDGSTNLLETTRGMLQDPGATLERVVDSVNSMGPFGVFYFGLAYTIAEVLAIPAIPLTASAGYLFGPVEGTGVVLLSASIAAAISFAIGRTLLRDYVEKALEDYPKFAKLDRAIGKEGFKLMLLLRLSPVFPFALSNYLYGASSIDFASFFGGTLLGFAPGTIAYVYTGYVGKALTTEGAGDVYPWYIYLGGLTLFGGLLKVLADTATRIVEEIEAEEDSVL